MRRFLVLMVKAIIFWVCCSACLWWAYSMSATVQGGFYTFSEAVHLVLEMSGLATALAIVVWLLSPLVHKRQGRIGLAVRTALETALVLTLYCGSVVQWRQTWTPDKGVNESAAFLPIIGHLNAAFFSEYLWLEFLVCVIPIMSGLSGLLSPLFDRLKRDRQPSRP